MPAPVSLRRAACLVALLVLTATAAAQKPGPFDVLERRALDVERGPTPAAHSLNLTVALIEGSGWEPERVESALRESARILAQCGIGLARVELLRIGAPSRFRNFYGPYARALAGALALEKPTVYFVADTLQRPAFDAEAIGFSNSRTRPELVDTVWVTRAARDLAVVIAHELVHVLSDSGEHSILRRNLMSADTAPENTLLSQDQCDRVRASGRRSGLLR